MAAYAGLSDSFDGPARRFITAIAIRAARETGALVTVKEHSILGGLGGAVAEIVGEMHPVPVKRVGVADRFPESGPYRELLDCYGLSVGDIVAAALAAVAAKGG